LIKSKETIDVSKNLKTIEWLKAELVEAVGVLFRALLNPAKGACSEALGAIIMISYLLGRRIGIDFLTIDNQIKEKINTNINNAHEIEQWYGDLSELKEYFHKKR
jgi:hypothetical protein